MSHVYDNLCVVINGVTDGTYTYVSGSDELLTTLYEKVGDANKYINWTEYSPGLFNWAIHTDQPFPNGAAYKNDGGALTGTFSQYYPLGQYGSATVEEGTCEAVMSSSSSMDTDICVPHIGGYVPEAAEGTYSLISGRAYDTSAIYSNGTYYVKSIEDARSTLRFYIILIGYDTLQYAVAKKTTTFGAAPGTYNDYSYPNIGAQSGDIVYGACEIYDSSSSSTASSESSSELFSESSESTSSSKSLSSQSTQSSASSQSSSSKSTASSESSESSSQSTPSSQSTASSDSSESTSSSQSESSESTPSSMSSKSEESESSSNSSSSMDFPFESWLTVELNGTDTKSHFIPLHGGITTGSTPSNKVFYGDTNDLPKARLSYISIIVNGNTFYIPTYTGIPTVSCCSNLIGTEQ